MNKETAAIRLNVLEWQVKASSEIGGATFAIIRVELPEKFSEIPEPGFILSNDEELNRIANLVAGEDGVWGVSSFGLSENRFILGQQFFVELVMFKP